MLRSLKELEFIESMANGLEIEPGSQGKVVQFSAALDTATLNPSL